MERGSEAERESRQRRDGRHECEDAQVETGIEKNPVLDSGKEAHQKSGAPSREQNAGAGAERNQQRSLGEHLAYEPAPAHADGKPDLNLALPVDSAREQ